MDWELAVIVGELVALVSAKEVSGVDLVRYVVEDICNSIGEDDIAAALEGVEIMLHAEMKEVCCIQVRFVDKYFNSSIL